MAPRYGSDHASRHRGPASRPRPRTPPMLGHYEMQPSRNGPPPPPIATFRANPTGGTFAGQSDSYRPDRSFDFRVDAPGNVSFDRPPAVDSYRPRSAKPGTKGAKGGDRHTRRPRDGRWPGPTQKIAADRPFLNAQREPTPELLPELGSPSQAGLKFINPEDLSDSSDSMQISESEDERNSSSTGEAPTKRIRTEMSAPDGDAMPRWSNPDPYTALPPPDAAQRKGPDVLKMIRKAKAQNGEKAKIDADTTDFISFDLEKEESEAESQAGQKRTIDEMIEGIASLKPLRSPPKGQILKEWSAQGGRAGAATPWCTVDHANSDNAGIWLHLEIMDFFHYVKPRNFEERVRATLVKELNDILRAEWRGARVRPFGSYAAGLYLPTADMDLVVTSPRFEHRGLPVHDRKKDLFRFRDLLEVRRVALPHTIEVISRAKVPIVKYVDRLSGLKVDVSFENNTGLTAIETFKAWKRQYPAMPILVTLIKHFLAMRGLNEPVNGGIGGFSVTCLVVSLLQHLPQLASRNMVAEHHLGEILMEFFLFYGTKFNPSTTAIQCNPPAWANKTTLNVSYNRNSMDRLSIIDPNNPSNDISGGSSNTATILRVFREAYEELSRAMQAVGEPADADRTTPRSILGAVLAGNYSCFEDQREILRQNYVDLGFK